MAEDEKTTLSRPVEPVQVTIIGTGDGSKLPSGTVAITPGSNQPNLVMRVVPPLMAVSIRFANLFVLTLLGFLSLKMAPTSGNVVIATIQAVDFYDLVVAGASVSLSSALYGLIKDCSTILSGLEKTHPLATGNI